MAAKATTKSTTPAKVVEDEVKDWTYLQEKEPSDLHEGLAEFILREAGIEIDSKQVQAVLSMHGTWQRSDENKARPGYRARTVASIHKTGATTAERFPAEEPKRTPARRTTAQKKPSAPRARAKKAATASA